MALKRVSKKTTTKGSKPLTMKGYNDHLEKEKASINLMVLNPINAQGEYSLGRIYKIIDYSLAYLFDRSEDSLLLEKPEVDLSIWFESKKPLVTWPLVKSEFLS